MSLMSLHIDGAEGAGRAQVLTCSAADAAFCIDDGDLGRAFVAFDGGHHLYGSRRAVAGTIAAWLAIGERYAVFLYPYGMSYLRGRLVFACDRSDGTCRAYL